MVLANTGRATLVPENMYVLLIKERFGNEFTEIFGIDPAHLPPTRRSTLLGFDLLDSSEIDSLRHSMISIAAHVQMELREQLNKRNLEHPLSKT